MERNKNDYRRLFYILCLPGNIMTFKRFETELNMSSDFPFLSLDKYAEIIHVTAFYIILMRLTF